MDSRQAVQFNVALPASISYANGTVLGEIAATPGTFAAYNSSHTDGTQYAKVVLTYDVTTDADGNVTLSSTAGQIGDEWGGTDQGAPVYFAGTFNTGDLVGLDSNAVSQLGRLVQGTVTTGILRIA